MKWIKILLLFILIHQVFSFVISLLLSEKNERFLSGYVFMSVFLNNLIYIAVLFLWIYCGFPAAEIKFFTLYTHEQYHFTLAAYLDDVTITFLLIGNLITLIIVYFSRYYMHREKGFKRFFNTILFFHVAYTLTALAGNFITMFMGWEFLGVSSFLLVAFYRERYLPVRNAVKIFSVYRFGDVGFIMGIWALNQLIHSDVSFLTLNSNDFVSHFSGKKMEFALIIVSVCFLLAAMVKSAQFPYTYWIARAMEGPTPSSAIFYGSLSINMGVLLLLRTQSVWYSVWSIKLLLIIIGIMTVLMANSTSKVQPSIKAKIAYLSAAQVGIMFIELAFNLRLLVLIHFTTNAFFRTYQLLVSPSVASYLIQKQIYFSKTISNAKPFYFYRFSKFRNFVYLMSLKEWNLDYFISKYLFGYIKIIGKKMNFINFKFLYFIFIPLLLAGVIFKMYFHSHHKFLSQFLPLFFSISGFMFVIKSYSERKNVFLSIFLIFLSQQCVLMAVSYNEDYPPEAAMLYSSGIIFGYFICMIILKKLFLYERNYFDLNKYYGHIYQYKKEGFLFLFGILCMIGFPVTPTFIGEDLILEHIHIHQYLLAFLIASIYILSGIQGIRMYARIFLGPHCKNYHEVAIKSS